MLHSLLMAGVILVLVIPWGLIIAAGYLLKYGPHAPADGKHRD